ncbi:17372_t:CDS:2 [Acaulospora colombiana]|uniref:17372_t:CDS:1 n=1 Tax=Acaulospora colombiana TaxID=27376 RepID=A0ACA9K750_9GLOM|nr:17372_t:CDS:2 [Acaulospora colombiana]
MNECLNSANPYQTEYLVIFHNIFFDIIFVIESEQGVNALADNNLEAWIESYVNFIVDMALKDNEE